MDIIKTSLDWAKDEMFSSLFFIIFGIGFIAASVGFSQLGKTELARSFITPTIIAGALLLIIGGGLFYSNKTRHNKFPAKFEENKTEFVTEEIARAEKTIGEFESVVFTAIPIIMIIASLIIIFIDKPVWRAASMTTIALMIVVMLIDSNSYIRMKEYKEKLQNVTLQNTL